MCDFCNNITNYETYKQHYLDDYDIKNAIIYDESRDLFYFYVVCDDRYYDHAALWNMKYCPMCGQALHNK